LAISIGGEDEQHVQHSKESVRPLRDGMPADLAFRRADAGQRGGHLLTDAFIESFFEEPTIASQSRVFCLAEEIFRDRKRVEAFNRKEKYEHKIQKVAGEVRAGNAV
jgi:hypothetical protein